VMLPFIVLYCVGFGVTLEVGLVCWDMISTKPLTTSFIRAFMWPMYAVWYVWLGMKMFAHQVLSELR